MRTPTYLSQPIIQRLPVLLRGLRDGEILMPRFFRRPFVWTEEQRLQLLESIYQEFPIGSIMVWRTRRHSLQVFQRLGLLPLDLNQRSTEKGSEQVRQYLLDGNQRLTTLYAAFGEGLLSADGDGSQGNKGLVAADDGELLPLYFDLEAGRFESLRKHEEAPKTWLPTAILFDPYKLYEFQKALPDLENGRMMSNRAETLASKFKDFSIPVIPFATEDLDRLTSNLGRAFGGGAPWSEVHMVSALTWRPDFDFNERIEEIREGLGDRWQGLDTKLILDTIKATLELDIHFPDVEAIRRALTEKPQVLDDVDGLLFGAVAFLQSECQVYGPSTLPYGIQLVLLTESLRLSDLTLTSELGTALRRWFWLTTYGEYFASRSGARLRATLEHLRRIVTEGIDPKPPDLPEKVGPVGRFDFRTARSRALAIRMAELGPRNLDSPVHDPLALLAEHGHHATPKLFPSRMVGDRSAADGPQNRLLVHPKDASKLRRELREHPERCTPALLASHGITEAAHEALVQGDLLRFLDLRRRRLSEIEKRFVEQLGLQYLDE